MVQIFGVLVSVLLTAGALCVIVASIAEEWSAVALALTTSGGRFDTPLPAHIRRVAGARRARIVRLMPESVPQRAAA